MARRLQDNPTQFGRAMNELGIQMIAAYSPQARGRSERMFRTLQDRLPKEMAAANIETMEQANDFLNAQFLPKFNARFMCEAAEEGDVFVPLLNANLDDILCLKTQRTVNLNNCVSYRGKTQQIPKIKSRCHYVKAKVKVHEYSDQRMAIFHGPRLLGCYTTDGELEKEEEQIQATG